MNVRRSRSARGAAEARVERLPAHPDGVDLVDEHDALAAPLAGEPLRAPGQDAHDDGVDADEGCREARAGDRDERRVEAGGECLREHRLPGAGGAEEEEAALTLAAGALECVSGLPDGDDPAHLLLRLRLPADVRELHAPLRVAGLEGLDLREVHDEQRAEEDREVHDHVEGEDQEKRQDADEVARSAEGVEQHADHDEDHGDLQPETPEPDAAARDHILFAQLLALEAEEARARDEAVEEEVESAAEADDDEEGREDRPVPRPALGLVEPDDERRGRDQRHGRGDSSQTAPLAGQLVRELGLLESPNWLRFGRHLRSVGTPRRTEGWWRLLASRPCPRRS